MFCPFCGKETADGAVFCPSCGRQIPNSAESTGSESAPGTDSGADLSAEGAAIGGSAGAAGAAGAASAAGAQSQYAGINQGSPPEYSSQQGAGQAPVPDGAGQAPPTLQPGYAQQLPPPQQQQAQQQPPQQPLPPPQVQQPQAAQPAATPAKGAGKLKVAIIVAAAVVVLGGGFAVAWFSGALDNVFNKPAPIVTINDEDDTTTTSRVEETTTETAATAPTTEPTTAAPTTAEPATEPAAGQAQTLKLKPDPLFTMLLSQYGLSPYISDDPSANGLIAETCVNYSNLVFGSIGNTPITSIMDSSSIVTAGIECDVAFDIKDAYMKEIAEMILGSYGDEAQAEVLRLLGSSEFRINFETMGSALDAIINPVFSAQADWLVQARSLLTVLAYADIDDIMFAAPGLTDKVFRMDSMLDTIAGGNSEEIESMMASFEDLQVYILEIMPYIQQMIVAAINEFDEPTIGKEDISLGNGKVTFDTVDVVLTEKTLMKAGAAALSVLSDSPEAQGIIIRAWNEVLADMTGAGTQLDAQTLSFMLGGMLAQLNQGVEYADTEDELIIRFYINDGALAGLAVNDPFNWQTLGAVADQGLGYSYWYNDFSYSDYMEVENEPPMHQDPGVGDRYEVYGSFVNDANGTSGDIRLKIRQDGEYFDCGLMTFSGINYTFVNGAPTFSYKCNIKMIDLYNAFAGKESSRIDVVSQIAYMFGSLDDLPIIKDLEFDMEYNINGNEMSTVFSASNPPQNSSVSITFKIYASPDKVAPPQGDIIDITNPDAEVLYTVVGEIIENLDAKVDALVAAGYEIDWIKPLISSAAAGIVGMGAEMGDYTDMYGDGSGAAISPGSGYQGYVFENSSDEDLEIMPLISMSYYELSIARNEIYARHGWVFDDAGLQTYFEGQDWYAPIYDNDSIELNEVEAYNVELISQVEAYLAGLDE